MAEDADSDQKTEQPTAKRRSEATEKGDVLQSRELGTALVVLAGAGWLAMAGPWMMASLQNMLQNSLMFDVGAIIDFKPGKAFADRIGDIVIPLFALFGLTLLAAIGAPALLGSLGFRWGAIGFKASKLNPLQGIRKIFGAQGLIELGKSMVKVLLLGAVGVWVLMHQSGELMTLGRQEIVLALNQLGSLFVFAVLVMAFALAVIAGLDVPAQIFQRGARLRMTKQEVKDEAKQTEGSPELRAAIRRRQQETLQGSARTAIAEATVVLTNPTHFAVALRYRAGFDAAPIVVARGRGATAQAIRELAKENDVPMLSYPELTRALYYTTRAGQMIREDLYIAVATVLAFVFNIETALAEGITQPKVEVPNDVRYDEDGRPLN
jgi:flagellar biosynthesis protein FlhB